ncbi:histidine kinase [candidate division KSB1 bacterium]|nr:histidine kinase [candidate division KSB1 bacterium]
MLIDLTLLLSVFTIPITNLRAQQQDLKFTNITIEDGLSHSKVNCIHQDSQGFLWFGTNEGLNKYDGYNFTVFQPDPDNPQSISANLIRCILEDSKGNFWIGTEAGGLNRYDRNFKTFIHFIADSSSEIQLSGNNINSIIEDDRGNLWVGTDQGLDRFDPEQGKILNFRPYAEMSDHQSVNEVIVVYKDRFGKLWIGTLGGGLCFFDPEGHTFSYFRHDKNDPHSIGDDEIHSIAEDTQGNLWIGTTNGGLNRFDQKTKRFDHFYPGRDNPESTTIRSILDDGRGNLWIGNRSGLYNFDRNSHQFTYFAHNPNNPYSLAQNSVWTIFKDAKGDLWFGTRGGLSYLNTSNLPFIHFRADANNRRCLNKQAVYAILEDRNGDIWFGTEHGGLNYLSRQTGWFTYFMYDINNPNSLSVNNIKSLLEDRNGNLWIGTYNGGLNMFDRKNNRFIKYRHNEHEPTSLTNDNVMALVADKHGTIWIGTDGGGLDRFDRKTQNFVHIPEHWGLQGFSSIHCLMLDRKGRLWMGANQSQIGCLNTTTGEFSPYALNHNMNNVDIMHAFEDREGNLWFGTVGAGLCLFNQSENAFKVFAKKDGLPSNIVYGILDDDAGNLWLSTTNGLCQFNPHTGKAKNYYKENGLQSDQFTYSACLKTRDGEMYFGGINGVTAFYPGHIQQNSYIPPVVITDFKILNRPVSIGGKNPVLVSDISQTKSLHLSYKHTVFSFEFVALNYAIPEQNQYAHKMEGFENDWNYVGTRRFATYTNLDPGTYTFRVKAANNDGIWNEEGTAVEITISPPFWKTLWFKIILIAFGLLIISHFINYLHQKRNLLKARSLANLAQLRLLRNQMNPHFLFNALGSIRSMILISKDKAWDMVSELSEFFRYSMLNFNKVEALLDDEINAVHNYLNIEKVRYKDSLQVSFRIEDAARKCLVPAFVCQPLIENAIKYGMQTSPLPLTVNISISFQQDILSIDVSNTGKLVESNRDYRGSKDVHGTSLENIKQRLQIMFPDQFAFNLFEQDGWVHAKILIDCDEKKRKLFAEREGTEI